VTGGARRRGRARPRRPGPAACNERLHALPLDLNRALAAETTRLGRVHPGRGAARLKPVDRINRRLSHAPCAVARIHPHPEARVAGLRRTRFADVGRAPGRAWKPPPVPAPGATATSSAACRRRSGSPPSCEPPSCNATHLGSPRPAQALPHGVARPAQGSISLEEQARLGYQARLSGLKRRPTPPCNRETAQLQRRAPDLSFAPTFAEKA